MLSVFNAVIEVNPNTPTCGELFEFRSAGPPAASQMIREETVAPGQALPMHGSLKRERGAGEHRESPRVRRFPEF